MADDEVVMTSPEERNLTPKQELFCQHYTIYWNATKSAKEAGYSEKTAMEQGYQLLQISSVKARIAELSQHALNELGVLRERVLQEYARIAFLDPAEAYDENNNLLPVQAMPENVRRAVAKVESFEEYQGRGAEREYIGDTVKVEFVSKKGALDSLAKYLGMTPDKVEHSGPGGKPIETINKSELTDEQLTEKLMTLHVKLSKGDAS